MEFDDAGVPYHTVLDDASSGTARNVEKTHYPRSGEPNPKVRLGIVGGEGGAVQWADLSDYSPDSSLISEVGWFPDGSALLLRAGPRPDLARPGQGHARVRRREGPDAAAVPRRDQGLDRQPRADPPLQGWHVPLAQRARRLEAHLPVRAPTARSRPRSRRARGRSAGIEHVDAQGRLDLLHRHPRGADVDRLLPRQAGRPDRAAHAVAGHPHGEHEPGRQALPVEPVRHPHAGPHRAVRRRRQAGADDRLEPRRTR